MLTSKQILSYGFAQQSYICAILQIYMSSLSFEADINASVLKLYDLLRG